MPVPPNFRPSDKTVDEGKRASCQLCSFLKSGVDPRCLCVKYWAFIGMTDVCDSFELMESMKGNYASIFRDEFTKEEKEYIATHDILDLQHINDPKWKDLR